MKLMSTRMTWLIIYIQYMCGHVGKWACGRGIYKIANSICAPTSSSTQTPSSPTVIVTWPEESSRLHHWLTDCISIPNQYIFVLSLHFTEFHTGTGLISSYIFFLLTFLARVGWHKLWWGYHQSVMNQSVMIHYVANSDSNSIIILAHYHYYSTIEKIRDMHGVLG